MERVPSHSITAASKIFYLQNELKFLCRIQPFYHRLHSKGILGTAVLVQLGQTLSEPGGHGVERVDRLVTGMQSNIPHPQQGALTHFCPPILLKAQARATTCEVARLMTGTHSMDWASNPSMLFSCRCSSCSNERWMDGEREGNKREGEREREGETKA